MAEHQSWIWKYIKICKFTGALHWVVVKYDPMHAYFMAFVGKISRAVMASWSPWKRSLLDAWTSVMALLKLLAFLFLVLLWPGKWIKLKSIKKKKSSWEDNQNHQNWSKQRARYEIHDRRDYTLWFMQIIFWMTSNADVKVNFWTPQSQIHWVVSLHFSVAVKSWAVRQP